MKTVILDGMQVDTHSVNTHNVNTHNVNTHISDTLCESLKDADHTYTHYALSGLDIRPCRSCGACGQKTPGECVIKDDMPPILRAIANCDTIVMLTPVTFGGYSATLKKAVDKFMVLGEAMYMVKDGHMLHPMRYGHKELIVIGVEYERSDSQRQAMQTLTEHNALNMQFTARTVFVQPDGDTADMRQVIDSALSEVAS